MTTGGRKQQVQDPDGITFMRRVGVVAGAALAVAALSQLLFAAGTRDLRNALAQEARDRITTDSLQAERMNATDDRIARMSQIMELVVVVVSDQADPSERREALRHLRQMRQVMP